MKEERPGTVSDHATCDREPIHIPAAIQPYGVLIVIDPDTLLILQISENVADFFDTNADRVLNRPLSTLLDDRSIAQLRHALAQKVVEESNPLSMGTDRQHFDGIVHRHDGATIIELEPAEDHREKRSGQHILKPIIRRIQGTGSLEDLGRSVVEEVRRLTGFERVMLYRFGEQGHGHVAAEVKAEELESYLGLHYPASDIPRQARQLYLKNWLRMIPDAGYTPARIIPPLRPDTNVPLDLTCAVLRSIAPVHRQYLANMGVQASMSVSLVVHGQLWGLISCTNHSRPLYVSYDVRSACEVFAHLVSWEIAALQEQESASLRHARRDTESVLANAMRKTQVRGNVLESLLACPEQLLALVDATAVAVVVENECRTFGGPLEPEFVVRLEKWLGTREESSVFATDSLPTLYSPAVEHKEVASGLLAIALPGSPWRRLLWFRPERIATVNWGGNPQQAVRTDRTGYPHPRTSFEIWKEEVRLHSSPWTASDMEAAASIRRYAIEADLELQLAKQQSAVRARDDILAIVSHDLRNPLSILSLQAKLLLRSASDEDDGLSRTLRSTGTRIQRSVDQMNSLISNLLDLAQIEAGSFPLELSPEYVTEIVEDALQSLSPLIEAKGLSLTRHIVDAPRVSVDRHRFFQVMANLIGNAIKFTQAGGRIAVTAKSTGDDVEFAVTDTGAGIAPDQLEHLFDRYWRGSSEGAGLGLFIVKGIIEAHGGRIHVESVLHEGTTFVFTMPAA